MSEILRRMGIGFGALVLLAGCGATPSGAASTAPEEPMSIEFEDVREQVAAFMDTEDVLLTQGNFEGFGALTTPDVFWFGPGSGHAASGRREAVDAVRELFGAPDGLASLCSFCTPAQSVGATGDRRAAWVAEEMPGTRMGPDGTATETAYRVTSFVIRDGDRWLVAAQHWSIGLEGNDALAAGGETPAALSDDVGPGADLLVRATDEALSSPEALEARISARPDVFVFGAGLNDRAEGGAAARRYVQAKVGDRAIRISRAGGVRAALAPGGNAGFVACNLDASVIVDGARTTRTGRGLFVWLLEDDEWRIVQLHISRGSGD